MAGNIPFFVSQDKAVYISPDVYQYLGPSTRGYSVLKRRDYGLTSSYPCRRSPYTDDYAYESVRPRVYDTGFEREQSVLDSNVSRNIHVSSATLDDNYDVARISRSRDQQLLSHANQAIKTKYEPVKPRAASMSNYTAIDYGRYPTTWTGGANTGLKSSDTTSYDTHYTSRQIPTHKSVPYTVPLGTLYTQYSGRMSPQRDVAMNSRFESIRDKLKSLQRPAADEDHRKLYGGYISPAMISPYLSPRMSPVASGCESPIEHWGPVYDSRPAYTYGDAMSDSSSTSSKSRKRRKPRVVATKRRTGNYYSKLLRKRAKEPSRQSKFWPYFDPNSLNSSDLASLCSDSESAEGNDLYPRRVQTAGDGDEGPTNYIIDTSGKYPLNVDNLSPGKYIIQTNQAASPYEYKPFLPRRSRYTLDDDDDYTDVYSSTSAYKPYVPSVYVPRLSTIPVVPYTSGLYDDSQHRRSVADTVNFNTAVATAAARARSQLGGLNLSRQNASGLVLSVSGQYTRRGVDDETPMGFHYVSRPIPLRGPQYSAMFPTVEAIKSPSDDYFNTYLGNMQSLREGIRQRLEQGYRLLRDTDRSYSYTLPFKPYTPSSIITLSGIRSTPRVNPVPRHSYAASRFSYPELQARVSDRDTLDTPKPRRRFLRRTEQPWPRPSDDFGELVVYPLPKSERKEYSPREELPSAARYNVDLYNPKSGVEMSSLDRINIEAALVAGSVDVVLPKRAPKSRFAADKLRAMRRPDKEDMFSAAVPASSGLKASRPGVQSKYIDLESRNPSYFRSGVGSSSGGSGSRYSRTKQTVISY